MSAEGRSQEQISLGQVRRWSAHLSSLRRCWSLSLPVSSFILTQLGFTKPQRNSPLADQISNEQSSCWGKCNYTLLPTGRYHLQGAQPALRMLLCRAAQESGLPWRTGGTHDWAIAKCNYCIYQLYLYLPPVALRGHFPLPNPSYFLFSLSFLYHSP